MTMVSIAAPDTGEGSLSANPIESSPPSTTERREKRQRHQHKMMLSSSSCCSRTTNSLIRLSRNAFKKPPIARRSGAGWHYNYQCSLMILRFQSGRPNSAFEDDSSIRWRSHRRNGGNRGERREDTTRRSPRPHPGRRRIPQKEERDQPQPQNIMRTLFEERNHLSRQLSKYEISRSQQREWEKKVKTLGRPSDNFWQIPKDQIWQTPPYEFDALAEIHAKSHEANVLLEVRDVRVPSSSHHPSFTRLAKHRLHLICYTHADLIDAPTRDRVEEWTLRSFPNSRSIFVDVREHRPIHLNTKNKTSDKNKTNKKKQVVQDEEEDDQQKQEEKEEEEEVIQEGVWDLVYDSLLRHLQMKSAGINVALTVGVANTGKSSLLMALLRTARNRGDLPKGGKKKIRIRPRGGGKAGGKKSGKKSRIQNTKKSIGIEDRPGKTRELTEYLLRDKPPRTFFLDVPGMTPPKFYLEERPEAWYALAATNLLPPNAINTKDPDPKVHTKICEYVLHCMNRDNNFGYVKKLNLEEEAGGPTNDIDLVLEACGSSRQKKKKAKNNKMKNIDDDYDDYDDYDDDDWGKVRLRQCANFLKLLNTGNFGPVILDDLRYPHKKFHFKDHHFESSRNRGGAGNNNNDRDY